MKSRNIEKIYSVLEKDSRLVDEEGKLLKNKVQELAQKMDSKLLRLILNDDYCKSLFIQDVDGIQVFDKDKFCWVVNSKDFLPDGFTKYKNAILLTDENGNSIKKSSDVVLEFPFKLLFSDPSKHPHRCSDYNRYNDEPQCISDTHQRRYYPK